MIASLRATGRRYLGTRAGAASAWATPSGGNASLLSTDTDGGIRVEERRKGNAREVVLVTKCGVRVLDSGGLGACPAGEGGGGGISEKLDRAGWRARTRDALAETFLPASYPASVREGYADYVKWQATAVTASSAATVLSSSFLLYAVGLGAGSVPVAGALNWVMKDGLGSLGTLVFTKAVAHGFDRHSKAWHILSSGLLDLALAMEVATFSSPAHFLALGAAANAVKGVSFVAGSATRAAFHATFARSDNMADVTAKAASQGVLFHLAGSTLGMGACAAIGQSTPLALAALLGLSSVHLLATWRATLCVPATLSRARVDLLLSSHPGEVPTPLQVARREIIPELPPLKRRSGSGASLVEGLLSLPPAKANEIARIFRSESHMAFVSRGEVLLALHERCDPESALKGYVHAHLLACQVKQGRGTVDDSAILQEAAGAVPGLASRLERAGWDLNRVAAEPDIPRARW